MKCSFCFPVYEKRRAKKKAIVVGVKHPKTLFFTSKIRAGENLRLEEPDYSPWPSFGARYVFEYRV